MNSSPEKPFPVCHNDIVAAARRIAGHARVTPVLTSRTLNAQAGASLYFKCENFQRTGAFKFRGAFNALSQLAPDARRRGVLAYSSGNHAQAVALAGRELNIGATIVMPADAPAVKIDATRGYGAEVILYDRQALVREDLATQLAAERGLTLIPPFNHPHIVAGQGTAAMELFAQAGTIDYLFVPCGGGGLLSGCAIAAGAAAPGCKVIGVEPEAGDDATRSFHSRTLQTCHNPDTIADGARTHALGDITFPLVLAHVHDMTTVNDAQLLSAMARLWERMKIVVEPTGALGAAAVLDGGPHLRGKRIGVIVSGGNADLRSLAALLPR